MGRGVVLEARDFDPPRSRESATPAQARRLIFGPNSELRRRSQASTFPAGAFFAASLSCSRPSIRLKAIQPTAKGNVSIATAGVARPAAFTALLKIHPLAASPPRKTTVSMKFCALYLSSGSTTV